MFIFNGNLQEAILLATFIDRDVVNVILVASWMLSNVMPIMGGGVLVKVSRSLYSVAALYRVYVQLSSEG